MELLVCIKQVPDTSEIKLDPETNNLIRTGLPSIVNPYDMHALEAALTVKDQIEGSRVTVVTMGPPQAEEALRQCLALGADDAVLVTDRAFGGADTLATSYTIASAIRHIQRTMNRQFQLIFCGKQAIDGDTAQVGPQIAEELGMAQATYACEFSVDQASQKAIVKREHENGYEVIEAPLPLLVTTTAELNEPRQPGLWSSIYAKRYTINHITLRDMPHIDESRIGLTGSPTRVRKVYQPPLRGKVEMLSSVAGAGRLVTNMAEILIRVVIGFYGFLMLLTIWQAGKTNQSASYLNQLFALAAALVLTAAVIPDKFSALVILLIGLLGLSAVSWFNGIRLYGRPHIKHHLIRLVVHLILFGLAMWLL